MPGPIDPTYVNYITGTYSNGVFATDGGIQNGTYTFSFPGYSISPGQSGYLTGSSISGQPSYTYDGYYAGTGAYAGRQYLLVNNTQNYILLGQNLLGTYPINVTTYYPVCYASGTAIRAIRDGAETDVNVQELVVGDLIVTASGQHRPVRWLGHRSLDLRRHPDLTASQPVRIRAGAFGPGKPARDLIVSPGHAVCVDLLGEVLVPVHALLNGATVVQEEVERVTYWHVELDSHDLLLAEGLPAESYLDVGNRGFFGSEGVVDLAATLDADPGRAGPASLTHAGHCRPFHADGALVRFLRERLHAQALELGWRLDGADIWAGTHLMVDGVRVDGEMRGLSARFALPLGAREVWLVSRTGVPRELGDGEDRRALGLYLAGLYLDDGWCEPRDVALDDVALDAGWHAVEGEASAWRRWTTGRARLPAALWAWCQGPVTLRLDLVKPAFPRWVTPQATAARGEHATAA